MSQSVEGFIALPPDSLEPQAKRVRQFVFLEAQPDGTVQQVYVEGTVAVDANTGYPINEMSSDQGKVIISLLTKILKALETKE